MTMNLGRTIILLVDRDAAGFLFSLSIKYGRKGDSVKKLLGIFFACTVLAVLAMTASAKDEIPAGPVPEQGRVVETEEDPVMALWDELEGVPVEEAEERCRQSLLDAGYTEIYEETNVTRPMGMDDETYDLAYSDLESADPETQEKILAARRVIIFQYSWQSDDGLGFMYDPTTKEFSFTPRFSDLFPGWDLPVEPGYPKEAPAEPDEAAEEPEPANGPEPEPGGCGPTPEIRDVSVSEPFQGAMAGIRGTVRLAEKTLDLLARAKGVSL